MMGAVSVSRQFEFRSALSRRALFVPVALMLGETTIN